MANERQRNLRRLLNARSVKSVTSLYFWSLMKRFRGLVLTFVFALPALPVAAWAGPGEDGEAAYAKRDYRTAMASWRQGAAMGDQRSQHDIGILYLNGQGVKQDLAEAVKWFTLAANQGFGLSQANLGIMYRNGA